MIERHAKAIVCANCGEIVKRLPYEQKPKDVSFEDIDSFLEKIENERKTEKVSKKI